MEWRGLKAYWDRDREKEGQGGAWAWKDGAGSQECESVERLSPARTSALRDGLCPRVALIAFSPPILSSLPNLVRPLRQMRSQSRLRAHRARPTAVLCNVAVAAGAATAPARAQDVRVVAGISMSTSKGRSGPLASVAICGGELGRIRIRIATCLDSRRGPSAR